jgi:hypothetical protein
VTDPVRIGGITESMVAVSVLKLVEEGKLNLDRQASDYLPEFGSVLHPPGPITVRQLLTHESGLPDFSVPLLASGTWEETMNRPLSLEAAAGPGRHPSLGTAAGADFQLLPVRLRGPGADDPKAAWPKPRPRPGGRYCATAGPGGNEPWRRAFGHHGARLRHGRGQAAGRGASRLAGRTALRRSGLNRGGREHVLRSPVAGQPAAAGHSDGHEGRLLAVLRLCLAAVEQHLQQPFLLWTSRRHRRLRHDHHDQRGRQQAADIVSRLPAGPANAPAEPVDL